MWTRQSVMRSPRPSGLARPGLHVAACWPQASHRLAWGILAFMASLCLVGGASRAGGDLVWEDQVDKAGGADGVSALAIGKGQVFAAGGGQNTAGSQDFLVRAYDPKSGVMLWEDQLDQAGFNDVAEALAVQSGQVFAAGSGESGAGKQDFLIRAYDAKTGALLWEDQVDQSGFDDAALALTVCEGQVFIAGFGTKAAGNNDFLVRAYQAETGALIWEDLVDKAGLSEAAMALAAGGGQVVAGGVGTNAAGNFDVLIRAYEVK
jgi:outer membrane protein assembly factor BamB